MADPAGCGDLFNPVGTRVFTAPCDTARALVGRLRSNIRPRTAPAGSGVKVEIGDKDVPTRCRSSQSGLRRGRAAGGYPKARRAGIVKMSNPFDIFRPQVATVVLLFILVIFVTMVYGADRRDAGRTVPDQDPLHLDVAALPYRQRLVRRLAARDRVRDRGLDRRYLRRPLVSRSSSPRSPWSSA